MYKKYHKSKLIYKYVYPSAKLLLIILIGIHLATCAKKKSIEFSVRFSKEFSETPLTGRAFIILDADTTREPRLFYPWDNDNQYYFAADFSKLTSDNEIVIGSNSLHYPKKLTELDSGYYAVQAVLDINKDEKHFSVAAGNGYSAVSVINLRKNRKQTIDLFVNKIVSEKVFPESKFVKEAKITSRLLSDFYGFPIKMRAAVYLPDSYLDSPNKDYPAVYIIPSFNTRHYHIEKNIRRHIVKKGIDKVFIVLDPDCHLGHHVFADSDNNGPRGKALVEEFIPYLEKNYRLISKPAARLLTGFSSGGWSSLWLQIIYTDFFGGVWSVAPDPVDFRNFIGINIYDDANLIYYPNKKERPCWRGKDKIYFTIKEMSDIDYILAHGGLFVTFESVFSPQGSDGQPEKVYNRQTGEINHNVSKKWEKYDIRLVLMNNWDILKSKIQGKIHIYTKEHDSFYLNESVELLREELQQLGSDAIIEFFEGYGHGSVFNDVKERINHEMDSFLLRDFPDIK